MPLSCLCPNSELVNMLFYSAMGGHKVADGIKVVDQMTLKRLFSIT